MKGDRILEIRHLSKTFGTNPVLKDIDFSVSSGDVTCIIGASGSGKSTLLRCLNLLETPTTGEIMYHGTNIADKKVNAPQYRSKVGMVFQSFNLFNNMTVLENCIIGQVKVLKKNKTDAHKNAMYYLEKVGIKVNLNLMPKSNFFTYIKPAENKSMLLQTGWSDASGDGLSLLHDMLRTYNREAGQGTVNRGHYSNPEVDALISQAFTEFDDAKRGELVAEADKIARDDYAYIPLHFEQDTYAIKDTLNYTPRMNKYVLAWEFSYK